MSGVTVMGSRMMPLSYFLTLATSRGLALDGHVLVDDADAAFLRHGDGQARLGDGVHGGGQDGQAEADGAGELGAEVDFAGKDRGAGRNQQDVVESQGFFEDSHGAFYRGGGGAATGGEWPACCGFPSL